MKILLTPIKSKKEVELRKSLLILAIAATLIAVAIGIVGVKALPAMPAIGAAAGEAAAIGGWLLVFLGGLFVGLLLKLTFQVLGGKGEYVHGLAAISYSMLPISIGLVISALLSLIPLIGGILAFPVIAVFGVIAYALIYKLVQILFEVDMITAFVGIAILAGVIVFATYIAATTAYVGLIGQFATPKLPLLPTSQV